MKKTSKRVLIAALVLPVIAGGFTLISFTSEEQTPTTKKTKKEAAPKSKTVTKEVKIVKKQTAPAEKTVMPMKEITTKEISTKQWDEKEVQFLPPVTTEGVKEVSSTPKTAKQEKEVDQLPEYVGGTEALIKYLTDNIRYPEAAVKSKTAGKVYVSFVVTKEGKVAKTTVKKGLSKEIDAEALRVVSSMPNWKPAEKDGKKVDAEMVLPVSFAL